MGVLVFSGLGKHPALKLIDQCTSLTYQRIATNSL
jgi:hypothetical protein